MLYITERCVFELTPSGLRLAEVAPGIDIERDILARMDFQPRLEPPPALMPACLFNAAKIDLRKRLLERDIGQRIHYDAERALLFLDLHHLQVRRLEDVARIRQAVETRCAQIGRRVATIVNYDDFQVDADVADAYAQMAHEMESRYYSRVSRYASGAFKRLQLQKLLGKTAAPPIFATEGEAAAYLRDGN